MHAYTTYLGVGPDRTHMMTQQGARVSLGLGLEHLLCFRPLPLRGT